MGSTTDKIKGAANEAVGKAKQGIGEAAGSDRMKGEGAAQELKGKGQKTVGEAKETVKDVANKSADAVNKNL
ncbi:MAG TPA: CsbD family protein [Bradyrhizobium sp.]|nr:CsbD family protein [Bradyrhizobium sp.]